MVAGEQPFDEDADILLRRPVSANDQTFDWSGFSHSFKEEIEIEMAGYETWDGFGTEWFSRIWAAHERDDPLGTDAQVIGLMSLDCVHGCKVELHPVFAMAVHIVGPTLQADGVWDDQWAVFARNWGNEGWCSHDQHYLDRNHVTFILPGPPEATGVEPVTVSSDRDFVNPPDETNQKIRGMTEFKANVSGLSVVGPTLVPNQGAKVTFVLGDPDKRSRINGYLHLHWTAPATLVAAKAVQSAPLHTTEREVNIDAAPRRNNVPPDNVPITHLLSEPLETLAPTSPTKPIIAKENEKRDRSKLQACCKQEAQRGKHPEVCGKSTQKEFQ